MLLRICGWCRPDTENAQGSPPDWCQVSACMMFGSTVRVQAECREIHGVHLGSRRLHYGQLTNAGPAGRGVAHEVDHRGRLLPNWQGCRVIGHSEIFLMNPHEPAAPHGAILDHSRSPRSPPRRAAAHAARTPLRYQVARGSTHVCRPVCLPRPPLQGADGAIGVAVGRGAGPSLQSRYQKRYIPICR
jgi:hypothetical protein